jgi:KDO2-lipid IV(A) lauroyltransferase
MIESAVARFAEEALPRLSPRLDLPLAVAAGTVAWRASAQARAAVRENLTIAVPERTDRERLVRRTFIEQARNYLEIFRLARLDAAAIRALVHVRGWERVTAAAAAGTGVILASGHLGPVSVCGQVVLANGYEVVLPIEPETGPVSRAVNRARAAMGLQLVSTDAPLGIHRVLKRGGVLGLIVDRPVTGVGERVRFFGRPALLPSAHIALALRTGATLIPAFAHRDGGRLEATFEPPLVLERTGDRDADLRAGVQRWAEILEPHIRRAPEQWTVFEPMWRR